MTLPTFILERRSLLEMYADFFAHPDLFKRYDTGVTFIFSVQKVIRISLYGGLKNIDPSFSFSELERSVRVPSLYLPKYERKVESIWNLFIPYHELKRALRIPHNIFVFAVDISF